MKVREDDNLNSDDEVSVSEFSTRSKMIPVASYYEEYERGQKGREKGKDDRKFEESLRKGVLGKHGTQG